MAEITIQSTYAPEFSEIAETLVKMNQLDPKHATLKDMDAVDARFACQACGKNPLAGQKVMTWQATVRDNLWITGHESYSRVFSSTIVYITTIRKSRLNGSD